jgi:DNA-binding transcriptional MerR regulator
MVHSGFGLLTPSGRSPAGYRLYRDSDVRRQQQVLFYRELEIRALDEIAEILADPEAGIDDHLRRQHRLVWERQARNQALVAAIVANADRRAG